MHMNKQKQSQKKQNTLYSIRKSTNIIRIQEYEYGIVTTTY